MIDKIRALLAHADSAQSIGSEAEAKAFAAKAQELLLEHKLTMTDVQIAALADDDPVGEGEVDLAEMVRGLSTNSSEVAWMRLLTCSIIDAHFCTKLRRSGTKTITIVGRASDRAVAEYLISVLVPAGERLATAYSRRVCKEARELGNPRPYQPKRSFAAGFAYQIHLRLTEIREEALAKGGRHALVVFNDAEEAVKDYLADEYPGMKQSKAGKKMQIDPECFYDGQDAGRDIPLRGGLPRGNTTINQASGLLGSGE